MKLLSLFLFIALLGINNSIGQVLVIRQNEQPSNARKVAKIKVRVNPDKTFEDAITKASKRAKKKRGNVISLQRVKYPGVFHPNLTIKADVCYVDNVATHIAAKEHKIDSAVGSLLDASADYSLLYVCRPRNYYGSAIKYNLHLDDSVMCRVKNAQQYKIQLTKIGNVKIWSRTEARKTIELDVEPGKVYFLNCYVEPGLFVGRPSFKLTNTYYGIDELMNIDYNNNASINYYEN